MTKIRLAHVQEFTDRHGIVRRYFRKAGCKTVTLPGLPGSDEFMAAYSAALAAMPKAQATKLIGAYYKADAFTKALAPETQRMRRNILDNLRDRHGTKQVKTLERRHVEAIVCTENLNPNVMMMKPAKDRV